MKVTKVITVSLVGILLVLGACASPAPAAPTIPAPTTPTPAPTTPTPAPTIPTPAPTIPTPAPTTPTPLPTPPAPAPATGPAAFVTSNLRLTPLRVEPKDTVTVTVTVKNTGGQSGTYKVVMQVNGQIKDTKDVTLTGGASQDVTFSISEEKLGDYEVTIDKLSVKMIVEVF